jgi:hypothetical protein
MSISSRAYQGLKVVVEWNPSTAQFLLYLLREFPEAVKYKDDVYGPLTLLLIEDVVRKPTFHSLNAHPSNTYKEITQLTKLPPFPQESLTDCKIFGDEWKQRKFTKSEFADALEKLLLR